jgi:hypothetical protein
MFKVSLFGASAFTGGLGVSEAIEPAGALEVAEGAADGEAVLVPLLLQATAIGSSNTRHNRIAKSFLVFNLLPSDISIFRCFAACDKVFWSELLRNLRFGTLR